MAAGGTSRRRRGGSFLLPRFSSTTQGDPIFCRASEKLTSRLSALLFFSVQLRFVCTSCTEMAPRNVNKPLTDWLVFVSNRTRTFWSTWRTTRWSWSTLALVTTWRTAYTQTLTVSHRSGIFPFRYCGRGCRRTLRRAHWGLASIDAAPGNKRLVCVSVNWENVAFGLPWLLSCDGIWPRPRAKKWPVTAFNLHFLPSSPWLATSARKHSEKLDLKRSLSRYGERRHFQVEMIFIRRRRGSQWLTITGRRSFQQTLTTR